MLKKKKIFTIATIIMLTIIVTASILLKENKDKSIAKQYKAVFKNSESKELPLIEIREFILKKTRNNGAKFGNKLPSVSNNGKYNFAEDGGWVGGFWPGINLLSYELTGDMAFVDKANEASLRLKNRLYNKPDSLDHDIGFLYATSFEANYMLTGDKGARKVALDAADKLISRYNTKGKFIQAWNIWKTTDNFGEENRGRFIIDCMFNLPILFWASEETGDDKYKNVAIEHANTTAKYLVRSDFTTFHTYVMDPDTGNPKYGQTYQGYADNSCWARGQAWAIGGFTAMYRNTRDVKYLDIAEKCAKVFIDNLEDDYIPVWDLSLKGSKTEPRDSSAAAIVANAMLELSLYVDRNRQNYYQEVSKKILVNLYTKYSTAKLEGEEGLLIHGCGNKPQNKDKDCSLIYGDYYFTEAITKLLVKEKKQW